MGVDVAMELPGILVRLTDFFATRQVSFCVHNFDTCAQVKLQVRGYGCISAYVYYFIHVFEYKTTCPMP